MVNVTLCMIFNCCLILDIMDLMIYIYIYIYMYRGNLFLTVPVSCRFHTSSGTWFHAGFMPVSWGMKPHRFHGHETMTFVGVLVSCLVSCMVSYSVCQFLLFGNPETRLLNFFRRGMSLTVCLP